MARIASSPPEQVIDLGNGFWNIRGSFKVGPLDVGTHCSLVRLKSGRFVFLDACELKPETQTWVRALTGDGERIDAALHLHPFHTVYVEHLHQLFPQATLHGTARHVKKLARLPWSPLLTEGDRLHEQYSEDFRFTVPQGVDFIPANENLHFASVLALHRESGAWHIDDTVNYIEFPKVMRFLKEDRLSLHPTLRFVLQERPGAADEFRRWTQELHDHASEARHLCAAHSAVLRDQDSSAIRRRITTAVDAMTGIMSRHKKKYG
ncbi:MAG: hypothetical protein AAGA56_19850 [Myxococcota bacterium]